MVCQHLLLMIELSITAKVIGKIWRFRLGNQNCEKSTAPLPRNLHVFAFSATGSDSKTSQCLTFSSPLNDGISPSSLELTKVVVSELLVIVSTVERSIIDRCRDNGKSLIFVVSKKIEMGGSRIHAVAIARAIYFWLWTQIETSTTLSRVSRSVTVTVLRSQSCLSAELVIVARYMMNMRAVSNKPTNWRWWNCVSPDQESFVTANRRSCWVG